MIFNPSLHLSLLSLSPLSLPLFYCILLKDTFIGFGGNIVREKVRDGAPWFVYRFQELIQELEDSRDDSS